MDEGLYAFTDTRAEPAPLAGRAIRIISDHSVNIVSRPTKWMYTMTPSALWAGSWIGRDLTSFQVD